MEKNTSLSCNPTATKVDNRYGSHYMDISSGCRVSSGLGIVIAIAVLFLIFALRNKRLTPIKDLIPSGDISLTAFPRDRSTISLNPESLARRSLLTLSDPLSTTAVTGAPIQSNTGSQLSKRTVSIP